MRPTDGGRAGWSVAMWVVGVALAARVAMVWVGPPLLSDDIYRYVHDGYVVAVEGRSPYATAPANHNPLGLGVNNPDLVTIYQPLSQAVFALIAWVAADERAFRLAFALIDTATVGLLAGVLLGSGRSAWWAAVYGWHPLVIAEVAWSGHQDTLGLGLMAAAVALGERAARDGRSARWWVAAGCGAALAAACAVKPVALPVAALIVAAWARSSGWRAASRQAAGAIAGGVAVLAPLYLWPLMLKGGYGGLGATVERFVQKWASNGSIHPLIGWLTGAKKSADLACGVGLGLVLIGLLWRVRTGSIAACSIGFFLAALLLSSTVHPWYLLWPLVLVPLARGGVGSAVALAWSVVIGLAYTAIARHAGGGPYQPYAWAVGLEYAVVYGTLAVAAAMAWRSGHQRMRTTNDCIGSSKTFSPDSSTM
ncbi:MAG: hypothetical protein AAGI54_07025 [Planctomycetota bacterium]